MNANLRDAKPGDETTAPRSTTPAGYLPRSRPLRIVGRPRPQRAASPAGALSELFIHEPELIPAVVEAAPGEGDSTNPAEPIWAAIRGSLATYPPYPDLHYHAARAALRAGAHDDALALLRKAIELNPAYADALILLARVLAGRGASAEAIMLLDRAIHAGGDYADVHLLRADLCRGGGDFDAARHSYLKALAINPHLRAARDALAQLSIHGEREGGNELPA